MLGTHAHGAINIINHRHQLSFIHSYTKVLEPSYYNRLHHPRVFSLFSSLGHNQTCNSCTCDWAQPKYRRLVNNTFLLLAIECVQTTQSESALHAHEVNPSGQPTAHEVNPSGQPIAHEVNPSGQPIAHEVNPSHWTAKCGMANDHILNLSVSGLSVWSIL